jgi:Uma2 family endonuclease
VPTWEAFPGALHQFLIDQIRASIAPRSTDPNGCAGFHLSDVLFRFPDGSLKRPDIAIFSVRPVLENAALTVIPNAVVEIVSSGYEYKDVTLNPQFYLAQGVQDVVIYDPATAQVSHYTRTGMTQHVAPVQVSLGCGCDCLIPQ